MANYRVFYLRDDLSGRFREAPATSVRKQLKPKDYVVAAEIEAANEYAAWQALKSPDAGRRAFAVGDVLEAEEGRPRLCQFGGFEDASWYSPELRGAAGLAADKPPEPQPDQPRRDPPDSLPEPRRDPPAPGPGHPVEEPPPNSPPD